MTHSETVRRCRRCDMRRPTRRVMRYGNETENRVGHMRRASICEPCARWLLIHAPMTTIRQPENNNSLPVMLVERWSVRGLRRVWELTL